MKVTGTWQGVYSYAAPEEVVKLPAVAFTLILKQGWFNRFTGRVTEDVPHGMPGTGFIKGRLSYPHIVFTKRMPLFYVATPDGRIITLREYMNERGHSCARDIPHRPILYQGEFSGPEKAQGTWLIHAGPLHVGGGGIVNFSECSGAWSMEARFM